MEASVKKVLDNAESGGLGLRTKDLGGSSTTTEIGDKIVEVLKTLL